MASERFLRILRQKTEDYLPKEVFEEIMRAARASSGGHAKAEKRRQREEAKKAELAQKEFAPFQQFTPPNPEVSASGILNPEIDEAYADLRNWVQARNRVFVEPVNNGERATIEHSHGRSRLSTASSRSKNLLKSDSDLKSQIESIGSDFVLDGWWDEENQVFYAMDIPYWGESLATESLAERKKQLSSFISENFPESDRIGEIKGTSISDINLLNEELEKFKADGFNSFMVRAENSTYDFTSPKTTLWNRFDLKNEEDGMELDRKLALAAMGAVEKEESSDQDLPADVKMALAAMGFEIKKENTPTSGLDREELRIRQKARSKEFGIEVVENSSLSFQKGDPTDLRLYGDPVNLKYPMEDLAQANNARVRFKQFGEKTYSNQKSRAVVHERIVRRQLQLGSNPSYNSGDSLDSLLPSDLKDKLSKSQDVKKEQIDEIIEKQEDGTKIQTLIFDRDVFSRSEAIDWAKSHDFRSDKVDENENSYRLRQMDPSQFSRFRTIDLREGVKAVVGPLKKEKSEKNFLPVEEVSKEIQEAIPEHLEILKQDEKKGIVYSIVLEADSFDLQNDRTDIDTIENAAHFFLRKSRTIGYRHRRQAHGAEVVESAVLKAGDVFQGKKFDKAAWVIGIKLTPELKKAVNDGELNAVSIGGFGLRTPLE